MKICPMEEESFHVDEWKRGGRDGRSDGETGRHKRTNSRFSKFCERA